MDELDRIDRQIDIDASAERVWSLISRPGWWINTGRITSNQVVEHREGADVVHDPVHGDFVLQTVDLQAPRYAAFRWLSDPDTGQPGASTLVEFWIDERPGGVTLRVAESGFAALSPDREYWLARREENVEGWEIELGAARSFLDALAVERSIHLGVPAARVWELLVEPAELVRWYAFDGAVVDARPGGQMELSWREHGRYLARVEVAEPPARLEYRLAAVPDTEPSDGNSTLVACTVEEAGDGCVLTVRQSGFEDLDPSLGSTTELVAADVAGWEGGLTALAALQTQAAARS